ncbi:MAG: hypothetical protein ACE5PM_09695 [Candidatus Hydrothermarchaeales archaeon]
MEVCKVCGISETQTDITLCSVLGHDLCPLCCLLAGGRFLEECRGCEFADWKAVGG